MALKESVVQTTSGKTEGERLEIAKEVVIKALLPVVFGEVNEDEREQVFDEWFDKLLALIVDDGTEEVEVVDTPKVAPVQKVAAQGAHQVAQGAVERKVSEPSKKEMGAEPLSMKHSGEKATEKQIKKIFALGHSLGFSKEELEEESEKVTGIPELSRLDKWQASNLIDSLSAMEGIQEVYG